MSQQTIKIFITEKGYNSWKSLKVLKVAYGNLISFNEDGSIQTDLFKENGEVVYRRWYLHQGQWKFEDNTNLLSMWE